MTSLGIVLVTHVTEVSEGLVKLLREVAKDVDITVGAGLDEGQIGQVLNASKPLLTLIHQMNY